MWTLVQIATRILSLLGIGNLINGQFLIYKRWPNDLIPYHIDDSLPPCDVEKAFEEFHRKTCIHFSPRTNQKDYIRICRSDLPYSSNRPLDIILGLHGSECNNKVIVHWGNIVPGMDRKFGKIASHDEFIYGPHNVNSVMHAATTVYGKEAQSKSILTKMVSLLIFLIQLPIGMFV